MWTTLDGPGSIDAEARYWSRIAIFVPVTRYPLEYYYKVWCGKTRTVWLDGENMFTQFDTICKRDRQQGRRTDGQTDRHRMTV